MSRSRASMDASFESFTRSFVNPMTTEVISRASSGVRWKFGIFSLSL